MTAEGARQRCAAVRAAYVVATVERELEAATGRLSSLIEHVGYA